MSTHVVFSPDCQFIAATRSEDRTARVWKLIPSAPPKPLLVLDCPRYDEYSVAAFSPDGCHIVFGGLHGIRVWDTATGTYRPTIYVYGHSGLVTAVAFSRDGQSLVLGYSDMTVLVWNFTACAQQPDYVLKGHTGWVNSVAFSPDVKLVVSSSSDETMRVWSGVVGVDESAIEGHTGAVMAVAFSHDGRHIASGSEDSTIWVWDAITGRQKFVLKGHETAITRVVFSPDSQIIASCSEDDTGVRIWDVATGTQVDAMLHDSWRPSEIVFSHDGRFILATNHDFEEAHVWESHLWEVTTGIHKLLLPSNQLEPGWYLSQAAFSPSDQLVVASLHFLTISLGSSRSDEQSTSSSSGGSDEESTSSRSGGSDKEAIDHKVWDASTGAELVVQDLTPALARDMDGALLQAVAPYYTRVSDGWIQVSQDKDTWHHMCWLPAERQLTLNGDLEPQYHDKKVCIGAGSGAVTILDLSNVSMPWAR
jgi:WD40 repeat protein